MLGPDGSFTTISPAAGADLQWRPVPASDGTLLQDPDFTLPTTAGPLAWNLFYDSNHAAQAFEWGYGRQSSLSLRLQSDGTTVTVLHEDGTYHAYLSQSGGAFFATLPPFYDHLAKNADGSWDEVIRETGMRFHFPAGTQSTVAYRQSPQGYLLTYHYDSHGRLESVEEPAQRRVTLGYASSTTTTVQYVQDWGDRRNTLTYDAAGNLVEVEGPTGCLTQYGYDGNHHLTEIIDPEGYSTTYTYDSGGRVLSRSVAGNLGQYTYQLDVNQVLTMTYQDPLNRVWTHTSKGTLSIRDIDPLGI